MLLNYIKLQLRLIRKQKINFLINILGLALGIASTVMIMLWIADELSYEKMHIKADRTMLLHKQFLMGGRMHVYSSLPMGLAPTLLEEVPEIAMAVRVAQHDAIIGNGTEKYVERNMAAVDRSYFDLFSFEFVKGNPDDAFLNPYSMVLTEEKAIKYFGAEDPMGKDLKLDGKQIFTVTGIIKNISGNTYLDYDILIPFETIYKPGTNEENWYDHFLSTYICLETPVDDEILRNRLTEHIRKYMPDNKTLELIAWPIRRIHLNDPTVQQPRAIYIYIFSVIGFMIIVIACINFINVSTSASLRRAKEIGIKKINGAGRRRLIIQFLGETFQQTLFAFIVGMMIVELMMPLFNQLTGKSLSIPYDNPLFILMMAGLLVLITLLSGIYPAILISAFRPIEAIQGRITTGKGQSAFRTTLVIFQFAISIALIVSTLTIFSQLRYMTHKNLGFDKENLMYITLSEESMDNFETFRQELLSNDRIVNVARSSSLPSLVWSSIRGLRWEGDEEEEISSFSFIAGDEDIIETLGLQIVSGRGFSRDFAMDSARILVNEEAARTMGFDDPVGKAILSDSTRIEIIGMFKDFHSLPLTDRIEPMLIMIWPEYYQYVLVRIQPGDAAGCVAHVEKVWKSLYPGIPFEFGFTDERIQRQYTSEIRVGKLSGIFTILAILISCIGLFAVSGNNAHSRIKEIGIRKSLGASPGSVISRYVTIYLKWVLVANTIALPVSWYLMKNWLDHFAYRTGISLWIFLASVIIGSVISVLTVMWHAWSISRTNPAVTLKYE